MTSRQAGYKISAMAGQRRGKKRGGARQAVRRRDETASPKERRRLLQLVACAGIFVLLVAVKLLLPGRMAPIQEKITQVMEQNVDVQAVFSAVGRAVSGEADAEDTLEDVYQAVFHPQEEEALETATQASMPSDGALELLQTEQDAGDADSEPTAEGDQTAETTEVSTLAYILYSDQNLPENVSLEQAVLGFDYCTPVMGTLSSEFGYREHPMEGEERFHYGLDIAADTGTAVGCFADGTVTAVGESSSYGKYCIVAHEGGYTTLYAHCSRITVSSGTAVKEGEKIAEVGETGMATGPHLHFELQHNGDYLNPIYYVSL